MGDDAPPVVNDLPIANALAGGLVASAPPVSRLTAERLDGGTVPGRPPFSRDACGSAAKEGRRVLGSPAALPVVIAGVSALDRRGG
ncbi:MAG: hypothetical protein WA957_09425, partial [Alteraurantiacibacter sp.]